MLNFQQWLEANNLTVSGGSQPAPETKRKACKDCGTMTSHKSVLCMKCLKAANDDLDAREDREAAATAQGR